jgi:CRP/FNR family transcriptional regulator, anaerobic regulatory protein
MIPIRAASPWKGTSDCRRCGMREIALFADLRDEDFDLIHAPIDDLRLEPDAVLYREGDPTQGLFTVRLGSLKLVRVTPDGRVRIVRVLRPGDVAGLEALAVPGYDSEAVALTEAQVCRIPISVIRTLDAQSPRLHRRLMQKWQRALRDADDWLAELSSGTAGQRVWNLVQRMEAPGEPGVTTLFSREDMGAMLNLQLETVSREISNLVRSGAIEPLDRLGRRYRLVGVPRACALRPANKQGNPRSPTLSNSQSLEVRCIPEP